MGEFWAFVTGYGVAPFWFVASVYNVIIAICAGLVCFAFGYILWQLFTGRHPWGFFISNIIAIFIFVGIVAFVTGRHENLFFDCQKALDATDKSIYSCHMRETVDSPWSDKAAIVDFAFPHQKYDKSRYQ